MGELTQQHLIAEYRELPRIFNLVRAAILRDEQPCDKRNPLDYTLGTGHCRFFYPRLGWLKRRQAEIIEEMLRRGYSPQFLDVTNIDAGIAEHWLGDWEPDDRAMAINRERIATRLAPRSVVVPDPGGDSGEPPVD